MAGEYEACELKQQVVVQGLIKTMDERIYDNDSVATNFDQIFESYSPDTVRKVL